MKGFAKFLIAGIIIILIGVLILVIGLSIGGWSVNPEFAEANYVQQSENIQNIKIDFSVGEIETVFYDGDKIEIDYHTSDIYSVDISEKNGTLNFKLRSRWWRINWGVINHPKTVIKLPENGIYNLELDMSAGSAIINGGIFGDLDLDMSAGQVKLSGDVICQKLNIDLSAGKVAADTVNCSSLTVDLSAGKAEIDRLICPAIDVDLSAGSVDLGVDGVKSEYTIKVDKSAGSCNVQNQTGTDSSKKIDIDLSAGSVNVSFTN